MALIIAISVSKSFWFNFSIISIFYFIIVFASPTIPDGVFCNLAEINLTPNVDMNVPRIPIPANIRNVVTILPSVVTG